MIGLVQPSKLDVDKSSARFDDDDVDIDLARVDRAD
jgi:hypothetical protein